MKLQEIFDALTYGEISHLGLGGLDSGGIAPTRYKQVASSINAALRDLHTRFGIKDGEILVQLIPNQTRYVLKSTYAVSARNNETKYILDSASNPFTDDIIKIDEVYTDSDFEMELNNFTDKYSIMTPSMYIIEVPKAIVTYPNPELPKELITTKLRVCYRAGPVQINEDTGLDDPEEMEIDLPYSYLNPLLYFVASRILTPVGAGQTEGNQGGLYYKKYLNACDDMDTRGIDVDHGAQGNKLNNRGFV